MLIKVRSIDPWNGQEQRQGASINPLALTLHTYGLSTTAAAWDESCLSASLHDLKIIEPNIEIGCKFRSQASASKAHTSGPQQSVLLTTLVALGAKSSVDRSMRVQCLLLSEEPCSQCAPWASAGPATSARAGPGATPPAAAPPDSAMSLTQHAAHDTYNSSSKQSQGRAIREIVRRGWSIICQLADCGHSCLHLCQMVIQKKAHMRRGTV